MDFVVYLAIAILGAVFIVSLIVLIFMCRRKYEYNRLLVNQSLRFSKLRHDNVDDIIQLSPHISNALNSNQWVYDVSGILEHCVAVLKLCHTLTDKLAKIPLNSISPQLNDVICQATARVVPRFDDLLSSMAAPNVDVRLIEARVVALTTVCWSLVSPFYLMNPKYKEVFGQLINDMEAHQKYLQMAVDQATINASAAASPPDATPSTSTTTEQKKIIVNETAAASDTTKQTTSQTSSSTAQSKLPPQNSTSSSSTAIRPEQKRLITTTSVAQPITVSTTPPSTTTPSRTPNHVGGTAAPRTVTLNNARDETRQELLHHSDEAPADPSA